MEKIWEELKKIEMHGQSIRSEAQENAIKIIKLAQQKSEELIANSKTYAEDDAQQLYSNAVEQANHKRVEQLRTNQEKTNKLRVSAEKRLERAASVLENAVLGENEI